MHDALVSARRVALHVDGHDGFVQAHAQQRPAVARVRCKVDAHALAVVGSEASGEGDVLRVGREVGDDARAQRLEVAPGHEGKAHFRRLRGLGQVGDERHQILSLLSRAARAR